MLTTGEPAGIGPDITLQLALHELPIGLVALGDLKLLEQRRQQLGLDVVLRPVTAGSRPPPHQPGQLLVMPERLDAPATAGILSTANADYVLRLLRRAVALLTADGAFDALVTAPVQKSVINDAGIRFTGHTEYLAELTGVSRPVMLLVKDTLRVALVTTHVPLADVPRQVTGERVTEVIRILRHALNTAFGIAQPRILVCGLNPHAGESGHLGSEEKNIIAPALDALRRQGFDLVGPVPGDTAFTAHRLRDVSAVVAMFHDQGLPVIKAAGFGAIVNVTLGLPIIRTSVDHGTALELAGTGQASCQSLLSAVALAAGLTAGRLVS